MRDTAPKNWLPALWAAFDPAMSAFRSKLVFDTITTRFLMLFLFLLSIPLLSTVIFTITLLSTQLDNQDYNQIVFSKNLFDASIDEARDRLDGYRFVSGTGGVRPLPRYTFTVRNGQLQMETRRPDDTAAGAPDTARSIIINNSFLNRIFRRQPDLQTEIWVVAEPDKSGQPLEILAKTQHGSSLIPAQRLFDALTGDNAPRSHQVVRMDIAGIPYRLTQEFVYSAEQKRIARVIHILPLIANENLLGRYYLGIYIIAVASLVFSVLLAMLAGRTITQPLLKLIDKVDTLSRETAMKSTDAAPVVGVYEIRRMGEAFNRMVRRLQQEHTLRDEFVATLTHDLKVPLLAEKQTLAYFQAGAYGTLSGEQEEVLKLLRTSNQSSLSLVNGLLEVYRYDAGSARLLPDSFNPWQLLEETVGELLPLAQEKNLAITTGIVPEAQADNLKETLTGFADRMEIKRVLINLISNAIVNTPSRGSIHCQLTDFQHTGKRSIFRVGQYKDSTLRHALKTENRLMVSVQDSGVGFTKEDLPNLFKRFAASRGRNPMSIGLGLYNCHQVIEAHNGALWVETSEGEGSMVNFLLPISQEAAQERRIRHDRRRSSS